MPVLACADALTARGARVETVTARSDAEIDAVLARLDGPARPDGLTWPDPDSKTRLVVATASDGQLRAVLRRLVRRYAPAPSRARRICPATGPCPTCRRSAYSRSTRPVAAPTGTWPRSSGCPATRRRWPPRCWTARRAGWTCCATTAAR